MAARGLIAIQPVRTQRRGTMDTSIIKQILAEILGAPSPAVVGILILLCFGMGWLLYKREVSARKEYHNLIDHFQKQIEGDRKDLLEVIDKYHDGQISILQAINDIKMLIATIGAKL